MAIWFTSDHHFGHANIIKYCERPFNSVAHMNASMIGSWNGVVAPGDIVYYLGDFAMQPHLVADILPKLNGKKLLIAGNHDRCHPKIGSPTKWLQAYIDAGFDSVQVDMQMEIAGKNVLLHHFPYRAETEPKQKYYGQRPVDDGGWLIHGHVHNRWKVSGRQINVSVENWNFEPVALDTIADIIKAGPQLAAEGRFYD
jgi:calcineurin-like phosphoesterase family protein